MAWVAKKGTKFGIIYGDRGYAEGKLFDTAPYSKGNGIYVAFGTQVSRETALANIQPNIDGIIARCSSEAGVFENDAAVRTNDNYGDAGTKVYSISFTDWTEKCSLVINQVLNTKVNALGTVLKGLEYFNPAGTKLTVKAVEVKTVI